MLKLIGFTAVSVCGIFLGLEFRHKLSARINSLVMFHDIFMEIKSMISYSSLTTNEIIDELALEHESNKFILLCRDKLRIEPYKAGWRDALLEMKSELCLRDEDVNFLTSSAEKIGKADIESELELIDVITTRLDDIILAAGEQLKTDGKICTVMGASCGIIAALLLI